MDGYQAGMSYEAELLASARKVARTWQLVGLTGLLTGSVFALIAAFIVSRHTVTSHVVSVDKATGMAEVLSVTQMRDVPMQGIEAQAWARRYLESRERYIHSVLQVDYNNVIAMSDDSIARTYDSEIREKEGRLKATVEETVEIRSVQLPPDQTGRAVIRFEKRSSVPGRGVAGTPKLYIATLAYRFVVSPTGSVDTLTLNPLGFKVSGYVVQAELGDPR
jgi:type IV secretion system protein VirB8